MTGVQFVTDDKGRKVAVQLDLKQHGQLWEDIEDVLVSQSRRNEKRVPLDRVKAGLVNTIRGATLLGRREFRSPRSR